MEPTREAAPYSMDHDLEQTGIVYDQEGNQAVVSQYAIEHFAGLGLPEKLLKGINDECSTKPTNRQRQLFAAWNGGKDVLFEDPSEKIRHHSLCLAILKKLDTSFYQCQAVIVTSSKDKAVLIQKALNALGVHMHVKCYTMIGGESVMDDITHLQSGIHVALGTPGRIYDMMKRKVLSTSHITSFAIENLNDMLGSKSKQQISSIFGLIGSTYQLIALSSMMHKSLMKDAEKYMKASHIIILQETRLTDVEHIYFCVSDTHEKLVALQAYLKKTSVSSVVIFCNTWRKVDYLAKNLRSQDLNTVSVHSRMKPKEQCASLDKYCSNSATVLIVEDQATSVVNSNAHTTVHFDSPKVVDDYIQRFSYICPKVSLSILTQAEKQVITDVGKEYCLEIHETSF